MSQFDFDESTPSSPRGRSGSSFTKGFGAGAGGVMGLSCGCVVVLGAALAGAVVLVIFLITAAGKPDASKSENESIASEERRQASSSPSEDWPEIAPGKTLRRGDFSVGIKSVAVRKVPLESLGRAGESEDKLLMLIFTFRNHSTAKKIDARPLLAQFSTDRLKVHDADGNNYKWADFGFGTFVTGQQRGNYSIYPGKSEDDVLVCEPPVAAAKSVRIEIPGELLGQDKPFRMQVPVSSVTKK